MLFWPSYSVLDVFRCKYLLLIVCLPSHTFVVEEGFPFWQFGCNGQSLFYTAWHRWERWCYFPEQWCPITHNWISCSLDGGVERFAEKSFQFPILRYVF